MSHTLVETVENPCRQCQSETTARLQSNGDTASPYQVHGADFALTNNSVGVTETPNRAPWRFGRDVIDKVFRATEHKTDMRIKPPVASQPSDLATIKSPYPGRPTIYVLCCGDPVGTNELQHGLLKLPRFLMKRKVAGFLERD